MIDTSAFYDALVARGLDFFCGVPDSLLAQLCNCVFDRTPPERNVICANEGSAVGMAAGWHLATGRAGVVYMQNSGEGNAVNPLLSLADPDVYGIPMLLVIGWRGEPGVADEPQHAKQGEVTLTLLDAMGVPYELLDEARWEEQLDLLATTMTREERPVALVVRKGAFAPYAFAQELTDDLLTREEALGIVLDALGPDDLVVSTTGKESREVFELREARGEGHARDFLTVGSMGHTASIAFGLASGCERPVWCLDGDGSMLMHLGSLAVIGTRGLANLHYVVNDNGAHESVGGQPTVTRAIDAPAALRALGFAPVLVASTADEITAAMAELAAGPGGALVLRTRQGSRPDLGRPTTSPQENKHALMQLIAEGRLG